MSYSQGNYVTMIDELPELDEIDREQQLQKHIRPSYRMNTQSGMQPNNPPYFQQEFQQPPPPPPQHMTQQIEQPPSRYTNMNCLDICSHIKECPICSRFYNNDKTVYIIVIIALVIICILLLKKVINI